MTGGRTDEEPTVVGPEIRVSGDLGGAEDVLVRGRVEGRVRVAGRLTIAVEGVVKAEVEARDLVVAGLLEGDARVQASVHVTETGRMNGDIRAPRVVIAPGASFRGRVDVVEPDSGTTAGRLDARPAATAPVLSVPARPLVASSSGLRAPAPPPRSAARAAARPAPRPPAPPALASSSSGLRAPVPPSSRAPRELASDVSPPPVAVEPFPATAPPPPAEPASGWKKLRKRS